MLVYRSPIFPGFAEETSHSGTQRGGGGKKKKTFKITSCTSGSTLVHFSFLFFRLKKTKKENLLKSNEKTSQRAFLIYGALAVRYCKSNVVPLFLLLLLFEISLIGAPIVDLYLRLRHAWYCMLKGKLRKRKEIRNAKRAMFLPVPRRISLHPYLSLRK